jgi:FHS family L-fucose permease-like MFS transporter
MMLGLSIIVFSAWQYGFSPITVQIASATIPIAFFIFIAGSYTIGIALTIMQVAVNPYFNACNVKGTSAVQRITIGGSANSLGSTFAPYFVTIVIFSGHSSTNTNVNDLILPFIIFIVILGIISFAVSKMELPHIEGTTNDTGVKLEKSIWSFSHLTIGLIAMFLYVGVEVAVGANLMLFAKSLGGSFAVNAMLMTSLYFGGMLVGRLIGSTLNGVSAKIQLGVTSALATILLTVFLLVGNPWILASVGFLHSVMWPSIFALSLQKLGKYTSKAAGILMIGALGGGLMPLVQGMLVDAFGNWTWAWMIVLISEAFLVYYAFLGSKVKTSGEAPNPSR